jgi:hypothetical protein
VAAKQRRASALAASRKVSDYIVQETKSIKAGPLSHSLEELMTAFTW